MDSGFKGNVIAFKSINERLCVLHIKVKFVNTWLVNMHATTVKKGDEVKEPFYDNLDRPVAPDMT